MAGDHHAPPHQCLMARFLRQGLVLGLLFVLPCAHASREQWVERLRSDASLDERAQHIIFLSSEDLLSAAELRWLAEQLLDDPRVGDKPVERSLALSLRCRALHRLSKSTIAELDCDNALRLARQTGDASAQFNALRLIGQIKFETGSIGEAMGPLLEAARIAQAANNHYASAVAFNSMGVLAENSAAFDDAARYYTAAEQAAQESGRPKFQAIVETNLGLLHQRQGECDAAHARLTRASQTGAQATNPQLHAIINAALAVCEVRAGQFAQARSHINSILGSDVANLDNRFLSDARRAAAELALAEDKYPLAEQQARLAMQAAANMPFRHGLAHKLLIEIQAASNQHEAALENVSQLITESEAFPELHAAALIEHAALLAASGRYRDAFAEQSRARELQELVERRRSEGRLAFNRAQLESELKDREIALLKSRETSTQLQAQRDRATRNLLALVISLLLLLVLLVWRLNAQRIRQASERRVTEEIAARTQRLKEQIERQERDHRLESIGRLTGGIAHDFNNLMTVVRQACDVLRLKPEIAHDGEAMALIGDCAHAADAGGSISQQLLSFARQQSQSPVKVDLGDYMHGVQGLLERASRNRARVRIDIESPSPSIAVDMAQLTTALINLVANSADALEGRDGMVTISIARRTLGADDGLGVNLPPGDYAAIEVADDGKGIAAEELTRVVEPFYTTKSAGSGLGLSMVHGFVTQSGGDVLIASEPSRGTKVTLLFPAAAS
ncbi:MAG: ATP-binding protein [Steroidobacteraceae bacterium]